MNDFDYAAWRQHVNETENLEALTMEQLKEHLRYFNGVCGAFAVVTDQTPWGKKNICDERIKLLRGEIQHRRSRKPSWAAIVSLIVALASLCLGIYNCSQTSSDEERPTPTPMQSPTPTPQLSPTATTQ